MPVFLFWIDYYFAKIYGPKICLKTEHIPAAPFYMRAFLVEIFCEDKLSKIYYGKIGVGILVFNDEQFAWVCFQFTGFLLTQLKRYFSTAHSFCYQLGTKAILTKRVSSPNVKRGSRGKVNYFHRVTYGMHNPPGAIPC